MHGLLKKQDKYSIFYFIFLLYSKYYVMSIQIPKKITLFSRIYQIVKIQKSFFIRISRNGISFLLDFEFMLVYN